MMNAAEKSGLLNKSILVVGLGKTGLSVVEFLRDENLAFEIADNRIDEAGLQAEQSRIGKSVVHREFEATVFCTFDVLICSPGIPLALPAIVAAKQAGVEVIGDVELFARLCDAPVIAVTGSNGKSSVVAWIQEILAGSSYQSIACGNIGEPVLGVLDDSASLYVLELSSFQLESLQSLHPLSATVLNVSEDHMDRYDDIEHYAETKRHIYNGCQLAVMNVADPRTLPIQTGNACEIVSFGLAPEMATGEAIYNPATYTTGEIDGEPWLFARDVAIVRQSDLALPGLHNVANALAVIALLSPLLLEKEVLSAGLTRFKGLVHRTQLVRTRNCVRWYNDSKGTNVDACSKAVRAMAAPVILIAGGQGKDADFSLLRPAIEQHVKALILIGQDAPVIDAALKDLTRVHHAGSLEAAVELSAELAVGGDAVLLSPACASFDMFDSFEHRGDVFIREVMELAA